MRRTILLGLMLLVFASVQAAPITMNKETYTLGETVIIRIDTAVVSSFSIGHGQERYRFLGTPERTVAFTPQETGTYTIEANTLAGVITIPFHVGEAAMLQTDIRMRDSKGIEKRRVLQHSQNTGRQAATLSVNGPIDKITFDDIAVDTSLNIGIETVPKEKFTHKGKRAIKTFAIDPSQLDFTNATVEGVATGSELWKCAEWNFSLQECQGTWVKIADITPGEPYSFTITPTDPGYAETGVASVNTKRPIYHPGELAELIMVVLDTAGHLVSDANITLTITTPGNASHAITNIVEVENGVYEATFGQTNTEGTYQVVVHANAPGVNSTLVSSFLVQASYPFDIVRETPVTIDPWRGPFTSAITLTSHAYTGTFSFTEVLPGNFTIHDMGGATLANVNSSHHLTWTGLGNASIVTYTANAPLVTPDLYALGPSFITYATDVFYEARLWYLAIDPQSVYVPTGTTQSAWSQGSGTTHAEVDEGTTPDTNDRISSAANAGEVSEFSFDTITETGISNITLWVYAATGTNAEFIFRLQQGGGDQCTQAIPVNQGAQWWSCTWNSPSGSLATITAEFGPVTKNGKGSNKLAHVYTTYLEVNYDEPPTVALASPAPGAFLDTSSVSFNFTPEDDVDTTLANCSLWLNSTGSWALNTTISSVANGTETNITQTLADASYLWNVQCYDNSDNSAFATSNRTVSVNANVPNIQDSALNVTEINQSRHVRFNTSITDTWGIHTGLVTLQYPNGTAVNYSLTPAGDEYSYDFTDTNQTGTYTINLVWANDSFGQVGQDTSPGLSFTVTASPPGIFDLLSPTNGLVWSDLTPNMTWEQTTDEDFDNYTLLLDEDPTLSSPDFTYSNYFIDNTSRVLDFALNANTIYYWRVVASDIFGNSRNSTSDFAYITDTEGPAVTLDLPPNGTSTANPVRTFTFTPSDTNLIENCTLYTNATGPFQPGNSNLTISSGVQHNITETLPEGALLWTVSCVDEAENPTPNFEMNNKTIIVDLTGPAVSLLFPDNDTLENETNNLIFNASATDALSDVDQCELIINGVVEKTETDITDGLMFSFTQFLQNGQYNWSVNCTDLLGNVGASDTYNLTVLVVDANPPLVTPNAPPELDYIPSNDVTFNYTPEDATGIENCSLYIDDILNITNTSVENFLPNFFTVTGISEGLHSWNVTCIDNSTEENVGSSTMRTFTIDTIPPSAFSLTNPGNDTIVTNSTATLNWTQTTEDNFKNYTIVVDNDTTFASPEFIGARTTITGLSIVTSSLPDEHYFWRVVANDLAGNSRNSTQTWQFEVHTEPPQIENATADPASPVVYNAGTTHTFNVTIVEPLINTVYFEHNFSGTLVNDTPTGNTTINEETFNYYYALGALGAGTYRYRWFVIDDAGFENRTGVFTYTVTPASSTVNLLLNATDSDLSILEDEYANFTAQLVTPPTGYVELYLNGTLLGGGTAPLTNISFFKDPGYFNITAIYDATQNYSRGSETHFLTVNDTTGPNITLESPEDNASIGTLDVTFQYVVNDSIGIANCSIYINGTLNQTNTTVTKEITQTFIVSLGEESYSWQIVCYDGADNVGMSETRTIHVRETDAVIVNVISDLPQYERGAQSTLTSTVTDEFTNPLVGNVTTDIIIGDSPLPWWNTSWIMRKPLYINETSGSNQTSVLTEANITGLLGNISSCNELRIIRNDSAQKTEVPYEIYSGDDSTWCYVGFFANATADAVDQNDYFVYYNNSAGTTTYSILTTTDLQYFAQAAAADEGSPVSVTNIIGNNDGTSSTIALSGGGASAESAHGRDFITSTLGNVIMQVQVRYRFSVSSMVGSWYLRYSTDDGGGYTNSYSDVTTRTKQTTNWDDITAGYASLTWTELNRTRLQGRVDKPGGGGASTMNLFWVEMNVTVRTPPVIVETRTGLDEEFIDRENGTTDVGGVWAFSWNTSGQRYENYTAVSEGAAAGFNNGIGSATFEVVPDETPPNVTLSLPTDGFESGVDDFTFTYIPYDINLDNCTLYFGTGGSFDPNATNTTPANNATNTFADISFGIGVYDWNVLCYDTEGNAGFAFANYTLNISGPDLAIFTSDIWFAQSNLIEGEQITIYANITNIGLSDANESFTVQFFNQSGQINGDQIVPELNTSELVTVNVTYTLEAGENEIVVVVDTENDIVESDEDNNNATKNISVEIYQYFFGNISAGLLLDTGDNSSFYAFGNQSTTAGHVFVTDTDAVFLFTDLASLTRTVGDAPTADDFTNVDVNLGTTGFNDSIKEVWGAGTDTPLQVDTFAFGFGSVTNVPYVNSTNTSAFVTGILWDIDDDSSNNDQYDESDIEDLVFVTRINETQTGKYGVYDYEIKVPKMLKDYKGSESTVKFYYEIQ